jgi:hypothetical protein
MLKRVKKRKTVKADPDENQAAFAAVQRVIEVTEGKPSLDATDPDEAFRRMLSTHMATLGRKGGKVGGKRRLETMTADQRAEAAANAAKARWAKRKKTT